jgi:tetratricopeptide (TPR) repeat protein
MGCASSKAGGVATQLFAHRPPAVSVASGKAPERTSFTDIDLASEVDSNSISPHEGIQGFGSCWDRVASLAAQSPLLFRPLVSGDIVSIHGVPGHAALNGTGATVVSAGADNILLSLEEAAPGEPAVEVSRKCVQLLPPVSTQGVSVAFLREFCTHHAEQLAGKTMAEVVEAVIKPLTQSAQCSLAEALSRAHAVDPASSRPCVAPATQYIIYSSHERFDTLVDTLQSHFGAEAQCPYLSIDAFAVNHHATVEKPKIWWTTTHRNALRTIGASCIVLRPLSDPAPLRRASCLWKVLSTLEAGCGVEVVLPPDEAAQVQKAVKADFGALAKTVSAVDFSTAGAESDDEAETILRAAVEVGGVKAASGKVETLLRKWLARVAFAALAALSDEEWGTSTLINNLATLLQELGRVAEAESLYRDALAARREYKGDKHPKTILTMCNLAQLLQQNGGAKEAEALLRDAYEARLEKLGEKHPLTLSVMHNLGRVLKGLGDADAAEPMLRSVLEMRTEVLGEAHKDTVATLKLLGLLLHDGGKLAEAESLFHRELTAMRATAGPRHPDTLASMNNLALLLQDMEKVDEALPLFEEALEVKRSVLGPRDPGTLTSLNNLAMLLQDMGKLQEAEPLFREAYKTRREVLGPTHPRTLTSMNNLAGLLYTAGKLDEAETYYRQCLDARRRTLGDRHASTLDSMNNLALVLKDQGKELEAEDTAIEFLRSSGRISEVYDDAGEWSEELDEGM